MPDGRTHFIAGTVCGALCSFVIQAQLHEKNQLDPAICCSRPDQERPQADCLIL